MSDGADPQGNWPGAADASGEAASAASGGGTLEAARRRIDVVDEQILKLIKERLEVSEAIALSKRAEGRPVSDPRREREKLAALEKKAQALGVSASFCGELFTTIMRHTVAHELAFAEQRPKGGLSRPTSVAYLGTRGTYSHLAAHRYLEHFTAGLTEQGCAGFAEVLARVEDGSCEYGLLPIENSSSGSINEVLDELHDTSCQIVGELFFPVDHALLSIAGAHVSDITDLYAHPQPVQQCSRWLKSTLPGVQVHYCRASSEALEEVRRRQSPQHACLASAQAAAFFDLSSLATDIADNPHNYTRFIAVARHAVEVPLEERAKTSLSFTVKKYEPGSLLKVLGEFPRHGINLLKLSSRPRREPGLNTWEEIFFADVEANLASAGMQEILRALREHTGQLRVLGCYPSAEPVPDAGDAGSE